MAQRRRTTIACAIASLIVLHGCGGESPNAAPTAVSPSAASTTSTGVVAVHPTTTAIRGTTTQVTEVPEPGPFPPSACDLDLVARLSGQYPRARQFVVVLTDSFAAVSGTVQVVDITRDGAVCRREPMGAMLGRSGTRPLIDRRSGDGTTPAGVFPLGVVESPRGPISFFGNRPDPGVQGAYRRIRPGDCYGATPGDPGYGHWRVVASASSCTDPDEYLPSFVNSYAHAAIIGANTEPAVSGDAPGETPYAAAIFLHAHAYGPDGVTPKPVSGCVTLALDDLTATLRLIDPDARPVFAIGPRSYLVDLTH